MLPAAVHAGDAGGTVAELEAMPHVGRSRTVAVMTLGHPVWLNGAAPFAYPALFLNVGEAASRAICHALVGSRYQSLDWSSAPKWWAYLCVAERWGRWEAGEVGKDILQYSSISMLNKYEYTCEVHREHSSNNEQAT